MGNDENNSFNFITATLKGVSQVILMENWVSGIIILVAIAVVDYRLALIALAGGIIGTLIGYAAGGDKVAVEKGLFSYNSILIALSLSLFLAGNMRWVIALVGAGFAAIFTAAMMYFFKNISIPVLTFPYITLTWVFLLAAYHLQVFQLDSGLVPQDLSHWVLHREGNVDVLNGLINGIGQVYFMEKTWAGILILVAVFWDNWKTGIYTILGTIIGWGTAYLLLAEVPLLNLGLYGYNAVLTIIAIAFVCDAQKPFAKFSGCIAAIASVPITAGINSALAPYGLPVLTMPFVLISWVFIGARKVLHKL